MNTELMFSSKTDQWATPQWFFDELNKEFNFTLDPCADETNHKCDKYYTREQNGILQDWKGETVFCNPPYGSEIKEWVYKCWLENESDHVTCVMLIPARTDTKWFHEYIYGKAEIRFLKGRLKFGDSKNAAPFPSMVVIFRGNESREIRQDFVDMIEKQPTAFNADKVVERLSSKIIALQELNSDEDIVDVAIKELQYAISIVKGGGRDE